MIVYRVVIALAAVLFAVSAPAASRRDFSFDIAGFTVEKKGSGYEVILVAAYRGPATLFSDTRVPITTERLIVGGPAHGRIAERDLLMSQLAFDLNGNGTTADEFAAAIMNGSLVVGATVIEPVVEQRTVNGMQLISYFDRSGKPRLYRLGSAGKPFMLYQLSGSNAIVALEQPGAPVALEKFPNPNVQVMVIKQQEGRFERPAYSVSPGRNIVTFSNEKFFPEQVDEWVGIIWTVAALPVDGGALRFPVTFTVSGITPPFAVVAAINCALDEKERLRTPPRIRIVGK